MESNCIICSECGKTFKYKKNLDRHIQCIHSKDIVFECFECAFKTQRKYDLKRHIIFRHKSTIQPSQKKDGTFKNRNNKMYSCSRCYTTFPTDACLKRHYKRLHACLKDGKFIRKQRFECLICHKKYCRKDALKRHNEVHHGSTKERLHYECDDCCKTFQYKSSLLHHIKMCQNQKRFQNNLSKETMYKCLMESCYVELHDENLLKKHYKEKHGIHLMYEELHFKMREKFDEWLDNLQRSTASQFRIYQQWDTITSYNVKFICHRTGCKQPEKEDRKRFEKMSGSKKLDGFCPAEITLKIKKEDRSCAAVVQKVHVGHSLNNEEELAYVSIDKKERGIIIDKLRVGVPQGTILMQYESNNTSTQTASSQQFTRTQLINYDDIANIAKGAGLNSVYHAPHKDDPQNVLSFIFEHQQSIIYFKAIGEEDTKYGKLKKEDFAIVYMDAFQEELLKKFGDNTIAYDSTHKTNPNEFLLHTVLTLDEDWEGVAVAFLLSNRNDDVVCNVFLQSIKERTGIISTNTLMTDMQTSFYKAFLEIMGPPEFALWCMWHVYERWRKNQRKIKNSHKRKKALLNLYKISQITDIELFQTKLKEFLMDKDPDLELFIQYIRTYYAPYATHWAYCYRIGSKMNVNMSIESFHSFLKKKIAKNKKIKSVYECLCSLEQYILIKKNHRRKKSIQPQRTQKTRILCNRHHKAVKHKGKYTIHACDADGSECRAHIWLVSSFPKDKTSKEDKNFKKDKNSKKDTFAKKDLDGCCLDDNDGKTNNIDSDALDTSSDEEPCEEETLNMYIVQQHVNASNSSRPTSASLLCSLCKISFPEFSCTCIDFLIKNNMCKHIHAVAMFLRTTGGPMVHENNLDTTGTYDDNHCNEEAEETGEEEEYNIEESADNIRERIINGLHKIVDTKKLQEIEKIVYCNQPAPFVKQRKQRGKNKHQKRIFS